MHVYTAMYANISVYTHACAHYAYMVLYNYTLYTIRLLHVLKLNAHVVSNLHAWLFQSVYQF